MDPSRRSPTGPLQASITSTFGGLDGLKAALVKEGVGHFGAGWVWLTVDRTRALKLISTHDAGCPVTEGDATALLVCDLWEHGYYIDYRDDRKAYLEAWFDGLANWTCATEQFPSVEKSGAERRCPGPSPFVSAK